MRPEMKYRDWRRNIHCGAFDNPILDFFSAQRLDDIACNAKAGAEIFFAVLEGTIYTAKRFCRDEGRTVERRGWIYTVKRFQK